MLCFKCHSEMIWHTAGTRERADNNLEGPGYWYCPNPNCRYTDLRPAVERYKDSNLYETKSVSAVMGISADTLLRLHKAGDPSVSAMHREGNRVITHVNTAEAGKHLREDFKHRERRDRWESQESNLIRDVRIITEPEEKPSNEQLKMWPVDGKKG